MTTDPRLDNLVMGNTNQGIPHLFYPRICSVNLGNGLLCYPHKRTNNLCRPLHDWKRPLHVIDMLSHGSLEAVEEDVQRDKSCCDNWSLFLHVSYPNRGIEVAQKATCPRILYLPISRNDLVLHLLHSLCTGCRQEDS